MLRAISTHLFLKQRLHGGHLDTLSACGVQAIEIFAARQHYDYASRNHIGEIADWFRSNSARPWALHAPLHFDADNGRDGAPAVNVIHVEKSRRIDSMDEIKRSLESAEQIPFPHLILHLGERADTWNQRTLEHAITAVEHLRAFARPLGVQLLLENLENDVAQPDHLLETVEAGHLKDVGFCLDVGHAHLRQGIPAAIATLGSRIVSCHLHDNAGDRDSHLWPGEGTISWPEAMQALGRLSSPPAAVLEISSKTPETGAALAEKLRTSLQFLENAVQPAT